MFTIDAYDLDGNLVPLSRHSSEGKARKAFAAAVAALGGDVRAVELREDGLLIEES